MKLWFTLVALTGIFFVFQNCGQVPKQGQLTFSDQKGSPIQDGISYNYSSNEASLSANLFRAMDEAYQTGSKLERDGSDNGYEYVLTEQNNWLKCRLDQGGGQGDQVGATVISYECRASNSTFEESSKPDSLSTQVFHLLEKLYSRQASWPPSLQNVTKNGDSYSVIDSKGALVCSTANAVYLCEYTAN